MPVHLSTFSARSRWGSSLWIHRCQHRRRIDSTASHAQGVLHNVCIRQYCHDAFAYIRCVEILTPIRTWWMSSRVKCLYVFLCFPCVPDHACHIHCTTTHGRPWSVLRFMLHDVVAMPAFASFFREGWPTQIWFVYYPKKQKTFEQLKCEHRYLVKIQFKQASFDTWKSL